jgi:hypothetical protein
MKHKKTLLQRIGINMEANAILYVVGKVTILDSAAMSVDLLPPLHANIYRKKEISVLFGGMLDTSTV